MADGQPFIDYYDILQVNPNCDAKILESAYRYLAKMYHPDRAGTADAAKFNEVIEAYRILRNTDQRAKYDLLYSRNHTGKTLKFTSSDQVEIEEQFALTDADDHARILMILYKRRREDAQNAGVVGFYLQE